MANPAYRPIDLDVSFRVAGKQPEIWNPETGKTAEALVWKSASGRTALPLRLESAGSVFVVFRNPAPTYHLTEAKWLGKTTGEPKPPKIEVLTARYEAVDGAGGTDVTDKVRAMINGGATTVAATNSNFGDPTLNHVKRLRIVYSVDGKRRERSIEENGSLEFGPTGADDTLPTFTLNDGRLEVWKAGRVQFGSADQHNGAFYDYHPS